MFLNVKACVTIDKEEEDNQASSKLLNSQGMQQLLS